MSVTIHRLYTYPIKSCAGIAHERITVGHGGLLDDRRWVIVNEHGVFMTQRQYPHMVLIQPDPQPQGVCLRAPGQADCFVPLIGQDLPAVPVAIFGTDTLGADQGDAAANWLSAFLGVPCRLLSTHPQAQRVASPLHTQRWVKTHPQWPQSFEPVTQHVFGFADGFPFLVANQQSLDDLNQALGKQDAAAVDMIRFRPNIVLQGLAPYEEDYLAGFVCGSVGFAFVKPCARCSIPNVDPATGNTAPEPGRTLARQRQFEAGVLFGLNAIASLPPGKHSLQVGDAISVEYDL